MESKKFYTHTIENKVKLQVHLKYVCYYHQVEIKGKKQEIALGCILNTFFFFFFFFLPMEGKLIMSINVKGPQAVSEFKTLLCMIT